MSTIVMAGDTVRVKCTFTDYAPSEEIGAVVDPDDNIATIIVYNSDLIQVEDGVAIRESEGIYHYDWITPIIEGAYYFEFKGLFLDKPQLNRQVYKVKFKPVT